MVCCPGLSQKHYSALLGMISQCVNSVYLGYDPGIVNADPHPPAYNLQIKFSWTWSLAGGQEQPLDWSLWTSLV